MNAGKTRAMIAHFTLIGWLIAFFMNNGDRNDFASFYIRQMLGLLILLFGGQIIMRIGFLGMLIGGVIVIASIILWVVSIKDANSGKKEPSPFIGHFFQMWFKGL